MEQKYNVRTKTIKFLKENIRGNLHDLAFSVELLDMTYKKHKQQRKK